MNDLDISFSDDDEVVKQIKPICKKCLMIWAERENLQVCDLLKDSEVDVYYTAEERMLADGDLHCGFGYALVKHGRFEGLIPNKCSFRLEHIINGNIKQELYDLWDEWEESDSITYETEE